MYKQPQSRAPLIVAIVLLLLPVLYVGSYLAMVTPGGGSVSDIRWPAHYRYSEYQAAVIYWPLEQIDRRMRPAAWPYAWEPDEPMSP